jgi:hypothetical protein
MPNYCLELYLPHASASRIEEAAADAQRAAGAFAGGGRGPVRYLRTTYLADDETCLHFFEAASVEDVADAAQRAGLATERITRSVDPQNDELTNEE